MGRPGPASPTYNPVLWPRACDVRDAVGERLALDQFQHERLDRQPPACRSVALVDAIDGANVGMVERRQQARLAVEAGAPVGIGEPQVGQDLDGDVAAERRVAGSIDLAHAAGPEQSGDLVGSEVVARRERVRRIVESARDGIEHRSAYRATNQVFEDRSVAGIGGQQRFDLALKHAVITAQVTHECRAIFDATGHGRVEDLLHSPPALGLAHVNSRDQPDVIRR